LLIECRCAASFLVRGSSLPNLESPSMAAICQVLESFSCMRKSFAIVWKACEKSRFLSLIFSAVLSHQSDPYFSRCSMNVGPVPDLILDLPPALRKRYGNLFIIYGTGTIHLGVSYGFCGFVACWTVLFFRYISGSPTR
jgi:hypothetical protein